MTTQEVIQLALAGMKLGMDAVAAANAGDLATAQANLAAARDHYAAASKAWDDAGATSST